MSAAAPELDEGLLIAELRRDEGEKLYAYTDSRSLLTIGVGRLIDVKAGGGISRAESALLLRNDVDRTLADLDRELPWWRTLSPNRQRALANMAFNLGVGSLTPKPTGILAFRNTLAALRSGAYESAAAGMLDSLWARQVGERAKRLARLVREG